MRAAAAVALVKSGSDKFFSEIEALIAQTPEQAILPAQAMAFALAHRGDGSLTIAERFKPALRAHASMAARIQRAPMDAATSSAAPKSSEICQTVAVTPGQNGFAEGFFMGSADNDKHAYDFEKPRRRVVMDQAFAIGRFAVTAEAFAAFTFATGRAVPAQLQNPDWPALAVSWFEAQMFCTWLGAVSGEAWRLPSEAEWEFACRAGTETAYPFGNEWDRHKANSTETQPRNPRPVGSYEPNAWGLWDMNGNSYEWCADLWHDNYGDTAPSDQSPWSSNGDYSKRVLRGGSWNDNPMRLRSTFRSWNFPSIHLDIIGFRIARTLNPAQS